MFLMIWRKERRNCISGAGASHDWLLKAHARTHIQTFARARSCFNTRTIVVQTCTLDTLNYQTSLITWRWIIKRQWSRVIYYRAADEKPKYWKRKQTRRLNFGTENAVGLGGGPWRDVTAYPAPCLTHRKRICTHERRTYSIISTYNNVYRICHSSTNIALLLNARRRLTEDVLLYPALPSIRITIIQRAPSTWETIQNGSVLINFATWF